MRFSVPRRLALLIVGIQTCVLPLGEALAEFGGERLPNGQEGVVHIDRPRAQKDPNFGKWAEPFQGTAFVIGKGKDSSGELQENAFCVLTATHQVYPPSKAVKNQQIDPSKIRLYRGDESELGKRDNGFFSPVRGASVYTVDKVVYVFGEMFGSKVNRKKFSDGQPEITLLKVIPENPEAKNKPLAATFYSLPAQNPKRHSALEIVGYGCNPTLKPPTNDKEKIKPTLIDLRPAALLAVDTTTPMNAIRAFGVESGDSGAPMADGYTAYGVVSTGGHYAPYVMGQGKKILNRWSGWAAGGNVYYAFSSLTKADQKKIAENCELVFPSSAMLDDPGEDGLLFAPDPATAEPDLAEQIQALDPADESLLDVLTTNGWGSDTEQPSAEGINPAQHQPR